MVEDDVRNIEFLSRSSELTAFKLLCVDLV